CDIAVDAGPSYMPFIRLALARYQPDSVPDAHLSRVTLADFVQLAPDRTLSVTVANPQLARVTVLGVQYAEGTTDAGSPQSVRPSTVVVTLEGPRPGSTGELAWIPLPNASFVLDSKLPQGMTGNGWSGDVALPAARPLRLVVKEYERLVADGPPAVQLIKDP